MTAPFALGIQLTLPEGFAKDGGFADILSVLAENRFSELELNIVEPDRVDPADLAAYLQGFGFSLTRLATGAEAKRLGLSLSAEDAALRESSVARCADLIRYASRFPAEVIIGFLKGAPVGDSEAARARFRESLAGIVKALGRSPCPVLIEATNRRETPIANTMRDAAELILPFSGFGFLILGDTYHMRIEGEDIPDSLEHYLPLYHSFHISDDNRLFPGLGSIDFTPIIRKLRDIGYRGSLVIEGGNRGSLIADLRESIRYLRKTLSG